MAIFLSSVPEAIGSTLGMRQAGFGTRRIFTLWSLLVLAATLAGGLSSAFLAEASPVLLTVIGAIAGGGILAMVSSVMMPGSLRGRRSGRWAGDHRRLSHRLPVRLRLAADP